MRNEHHLPYGDILKMFLLNPNMPKSELKETLRKRGVFFADDSKEYLVSFLSRSAVSPSEFGSLEEAIRTKEENPKVRTQSIAAQETDEFLLDALSDEFDLRSIVDNASPFTNYRIIGSPVLTPVNGNLDDVELDFTIERKDLTKSWEERTARFDGKVAVKRIGGDIGITISQTHTSGETKEVAEKATRHVVSILQQKKHIATGAVVTKIKFSDFTNKNRAKFLKKLLQDRKDPDLSFADLRQVGMRPAEDVEFPEKISWMSDPFKSMDFKGDKMQSIIFLKQEDLHPFIEIYSMQAMMSFEYVDCKGDCEVLCEFPDLLSRRRRDAELVVSIDRISISESQDGIKLSKIKERILDVMNRNKIAAYKELASTNT